MTRPLARDKSVPGGLRPRRYASDQWKGGKRGPYKVDHLTRDDFMLIRELAQHLSHAEIARKFETSKTHVFRICNYDTPEPVR